jgi:tRNA G10  N-methylase Trm11
MGIRLDDHNRKQTYIYTYAYREEEHSLCGLELRSFFGFQPPPYIFESSLRIDPSRSPFLKERIEIIYEGNRLQDIVEQAKGLQLSGATFKVICVKNDGTLKSGEEGYEERRAIEREIGWNIEGEADMHKPDRVYGVTNLDERWVFGIYVKNEAVWLKHNKKPQSYSTALSTRVARAVVNIAVPNPAGIKAIDPCCGIGTVLVEALSMGIDMAGRDMNPLITRGARENIAHFGLEGEVVLGAIQNVTESYDVAIIDMPYNLCSVISPEEKLSMLQSARSFTKKVVVITIEPMDDLLLTAGFRIIDRCIAKKGTFSRQILVCV